MYSRGIAIVAITKRGVETALKIKKALDTLDYPSNVYAPKKYDCDGVLALDKKIGEIFSEIYHNVSAIVSVMAIGITIRAAAAHLQGKLVDPAVVGVDVNGKFVVSLLSGHYGRANELSRLIAEGIGATAVITTASDSLGKQSVDELARILHLTIVNPQSLVAVNAAIVNEEPFVLILVGNARIPKDSVFGCKVEKATAVEQAVEIANRYSAAAIVTNETVPMQRLSKPTVVLKPKRLIVGIGARKEITQTQVLEAVHSALARLNLPLERIDGLATVEIKRKSQSMISAAEMLDLKLEFVSLKDIAALKHEDLSPDSKLVMEKIGVGGVCERAALIIAGNNSKLILKKTKQNGVTVAIAEGE